MKFGPVTPELTKLICERQVQQGQKTGAFSQIYPDIIILHYTILYYIILYWTDFTIFLPYESTLRADDGYVPYFPICQLNDVAKLLSTLTNTTCIRCTSARKRIAISWSSCAH